MVKEFNLYEERKFGIGIDEYIYLERDIKEFIEVLKDTIMIKQENPTEMIDEYNKELFDKIDKLVGDLK